MLSRFTTLSKMFKFLLLLLLSDGEEYGTLVPSPLPVIPEKKEEEIYLIYDKDFAKRNTFVAKGKNLPLVSCSILVIEPSVVKVDEPYIRQLSLVKIVGGKNIREYPACMFQKCEHITSFTVSDKATALPDFMFEDCTHLREVKNLSYSEILRFGRRTFANCTFLEKMIIPTHLQRIPKQCFSKCTHLKKVLFSVYTRFIEESAFEYCEGLKEIAFNRNVRLIEKNAFFNCGLVTVRFKHINRDALQMDLSAFSGCNVQKVYLKKSWKVFSRLLRRVFSPETVFVYE